MSRDDRLSKVGEPTGIRRESRPVGFTHPARTADEALNQGRLGED